MKMQENKEQVVYELENQEVNVYMEDCGATKLNCVTDCLGVSPFITTQE